MTTQITRQDLSLAEVMTTQMTRQGLSRAEVTTRQSVTVTAQTTMYHVKTKWRGIYIWHLTT
eukprot:scaffold36263_cov40-Cyclotella_meneghiniana.AAC.3